MPRRRQIDAADAWHHVTNRGIARRSIFERRSDVRYFLARLARVVREGLLEVHAYSILTTHFHLLVRSPQGRLSDAMQRLEDAYARWFNRLRRRDGPLFRGRFWSNGIETEAYWLAVLRYIDENPVAARIVHSGGDYPFGSAFHYRRASGPSWLSRGEVEAVVCRWLDLRTYEPAAYDRLFSSSPAEGARWCVERRIASPPADRRGYDDLVGATAEEVRAWMTRKSLLADGTLPGSALASPMTLRRRIGLERARDPGKRLRLGRQSRSWWDLLECGLLRAASALSYREIAILLRIPRSTAKDRALDHERALRAAGEYALAASRLVFESMREDFLPPIARRP